MKKFLCIFLILVICSSFFILSAHAEGSGMLYFLYANTIADLSVLDSKDSFYHYNEENIHDFLLYFPFALSDVENSPEFNSVVASGTLTICFDDSHPYNYNYSSIYPSLIGYNRTVNNTFSRTVDITDYYDSSRGNLFYYGPAANVFTQTNFINDDSFKYIIINYIIVCDSSSLSNVALKFNSSYPLYDFKLESSDFKCFSVNAPSREVENAINNLNTSTSAGLGNVQSAVNALSSLTQSNFASTEQLLNSLDTAISNLQDSVTDSVYNALDDWHQHELDFVQTDMNPIVQGVVDDINELYDYDTFYGAFNSVVNMVTGGNTRAAPTTRLRIPAGVVTVGGQTYRFWDETYVDFAPVFENSMIQLLLVPFRFLIAYGFLRYCMFWINKLINTITLHIKVGDY